MNPFKMFLGTLFSKQSSEYTHKTDLYGIEIHSLTGKPIVLSEFKGKYILFVNVASKCGFTPQYKELQELSETYTDNLIVIGVPCNQFGNQEPGDSSAIESFCEINYGVTFTITEKVKVKGSDKHPLYQWLTEKEKNGVKSSSVKWNFQKYLVSPNGDLVDYFFSMTSPTNTKITKHLK